MKLLVVAYPEISQDYFEKIQSTREKYSKLNYKVIEPHFTIVFPFTGIEPDSLIEHLTLRLEKFQPFEFILDKAVSTSDEEGSYVFLVPGVGYEIIEKLHDQLYTGILASKLRSDVPFIPHLTVGNGLTSSDSQTLVKNLNEENILIPGIIKSLDLIHRQNQSVETIMKITL